MKIRPVIIIISILIILGCISLNENKANGTVNEKALEEANNSLTIGVMQKPDVISYEENDFTNWLEQKLGIDLNFVYFPYDSTECAQQLATMFSTGEKLPDILFDFTSIDLATSYTYGEKGYFINLLPYFSEGPSNFEEAISTRVSQKEDKSKILSYGINPSNGELYGFPEYQYSPGLEICRNVPMINKVWLDDLGMEMPETIDELHDVLVAFNSNDMNKNGIQDEIPAIGSLCNKGDLIEYILNAYVYCNAYYFFNVDNDKIWAPYNTEEYRKGLIELNKWYSEGLISPLTFTLSKNENVMPLFCPLDDIARVGVVCGHPSLITDTNASTCFEYVFLPSLDDETGLGGYVSVNGNKFLYQTFITRDCNNPELAFSFLDFLCSKEAMLFMRYGKEGRDWESRTIDEKEYLHLFNVNAFSDKNSINYHVIGATIIDYSLIPKDTSISDEDYRNDNINWDSRKTLWMNASIRDPFLQSINEQGRKKQSRVEELLFNKEESEIDKSIQADIRNCVEDYRALFITGVLDPMSDADWNRYLTALYNRGYCEYIAIAQSAWSRMASGQ